MNFSRRGFLQTMLAAAVGAAANFDPLKGLWVPGRDETTPVTITDVTDVAIPWTENVVDDQIEINDIALRFAQAMGARLSSNYTQPLILRTVMLQHAGHIELGTITLEDSDGGDAGRGHFSPAPHRVVKELASLRTDQINGAAYDMGRAVRNYDAFAPIGTDLRAGVPFAGCLVGCATDPESGLSARALRFTTIDKEVHTSVEMAVGNWHGYGARARRRQESGSARPRVLLSPEWT